jgi:hypothetical protein
MAHASFGTAVQNANIKLKFNICVRDFQGTGPSESEATMDGAVRTLYP